jgi:hypothetical protein
MPASFIIARSLAPSPIAIACCGKRDCRTGFAQCARLAGGVDDFATVLRRAAHPAGEAAADDLQFICAREVELKTLLQPLRVEAEAARDEEGFQARSLARREQYFHAGIEPHLLVVNPLQQVAIDAREHGHAPAQALLVVGDLAAHRRLGDRRDLSTLAGIRGNLVKRFDVDKGRVHVNGQQPEVGELLP